MSFFRSICCLAAVITLATLPVSAQIILEAEDFNFDNGQFIDDPAAGAYANKGIALGTPGVDFAENTPGTRAANEYRTPAGGSPGLPQTSVSVDGERVAGVAEYDLVMFESGEWVNFTRTFPAGDYLVAAQVQTAEDGGEPFIARLEKVTTDPKARNQSATAMGVFLGRNASATHGPLEMTDVGGTPVTIHLDGEETVRLAVQTGSFNINFLQFTTAGEAAPMPTIDITAPSNEVGIQPGSNLEITLTVPDPAVVSGVQVLANSADDEELTLGEIASAPYTVTWPDVPEGTFRLLGIVVSTDGQIGLSSEITVFSDGTPPSILDARGRTIEDVVLTFTEPMNRDSAGNPDNYVIMAEDGSALAVTGISVSNDGRVILATAEQSVGTQYTITVNNLTDRAGNPLAADTQTEFFGNGPLLQNNIGLVVFEAEHFDRNLDGLWIEDTERGTPSGGVSMVVPNGGGGSEAETKLEYDIKFVKTGEHYIWYRASAIDGVDDSAWLHVNGARPAERADANFASMTGFGNQEDFVWRSQAQDGGGVMSFTIDTPGVHTIGVARREDGAFFDKFVIGTDPNFDPGAIGDFGPALTPREGEVVETSNEVAITLDPVDVTGDEHSTITLEAAGELVRGEIILFQWQQKQGDEWTDIPDATLPTFTIERASLAWNGAVVRFAASTEGDSKVSGEATITVIPETTAPQIVGLSGVNQRISVQFDEPLDAASAAEVANYAVSSDAGPLAVTSVEFLGSERAVAITTAQQTIGTKYSVTISGIRDQAASPNEVATTTLRFYSLGALLPQGDDGLLVFEAENFTENASDLWEEDTTRGTPSGGISMVIPNGNGGGEEDKLEYELTFTQTGEHIIWYRASGPNGNDDSGWFHFDGARPEARVDGNMASMTGFGDTEDFVWRSNPQEGGGQMTFTVAEAGVHRVGLGRREDGAYFDKFAITTDPDFNPESFGPFGPAETREGAPPLPTLAIDGPTTVAEGGNLVVTPDISATERTIAKVEYFADSEKIGEVTSSPFTFTWVNPLPGFYTVTAVLVDDTGARVSGGGSIDVNVEGVDAGGTPMVDGAGKSVIWISQVESDAGGGFKELLGLSSFDVTELFIMDPTAAEQATLNAADVVVISRKTSSGDYNNSTWDETITAPLILMTPYLSRDNRWQWLGGDNLVDDTPATIVAEVPAHPIFSGVVLTDGVSDAWHTTVDRGTTIATDPIANGGTVLASGNGNMVVSEWPANTVAVGPRMLFSAGSRELDGAAIDTAGKFDLTPAGARAFLNAVLYMSTLDPNAGGDLGISIERTANGVNITLSGSAAFDVEYSSTLEDGSWSVIANDITDSFEDTDAARTGSGAGFYRGVAK